MSNPSDWPKRISLAVLTVYWALLLAVTHVPVVPPTLSLRHGDKWVHAAAYAGLALLLALAWSLRTTFAWRGWLAALAILALYGALDEITQIPLGRHGELTDWQADVGGSICGLAVFLAARGLLRRAAFTRWVSADDSRPDRST